jgi:hypothetical protein
MHQLGIYKTSLYSRNKDVIVTKKEGTKTTQTDWMT